MLNSETKMNLTKLSTEAMIPDGKLAPAKNEFESKERADHTCEPIRSKEEINLVCNYLLENKRYRDYALFVCGINLGLRVSDLISLRFADLIYQDEKSGNFYFKHTFAIEEQKTKNTRSQRRNRYLSINRAVQKAVTTYLDSMDRTPSLDEYIFTSQSAKDYGKKPPKNRSKKHAGHLRRESVYRLMSKLAKELNLPEKIGTHSLRKTFAYHQLLSGDNSQRKLILIQKMFGHSSLTETLDYVGITRSEIEKAYLECVLGLEPEEQGADKDDSAVDAVELGMVDPSLDYTSSAIGRLAA